MAVVVETSVWDLNPISHLLLFLFCFASISLFPFFSNPARSPDPASAPFLRFQRAFLLIFSLASLIGGLESVFGDYEFRRYGMEREEAVVCLAAGAAAALVGGTLLGVISDITGPRKACMLFCVLHLVVAVLKSVTKHPSVFIIRICLSLASSIFSFSFETWMTIEHEKQGHRQDLLMDTFWLMTFSECASLIGSQVLANFFAKDLNKGSFVPAAPAALIALLSIIYIGKEWCSSRHSVSIRKYRDSLYEHLIHDKRIWLLAMAQGFFHFSVSMFWILWAPTVVADGRELRLSLLYPCFLGARMLGSTAVPWFYDGSSPFRNDDCLTAAFVVAGLCLSVVAFDYQEIGVLVMLFSIFSTCIGLIVPSLARLRTMYVPNELRGGMISLSLAPSNAGVLFFLIQGGYYRNVSNSTIMTIAALGLFCGAGCIHVLKRWKKQTLQNWHKL